MDGNCTAQPVTGAVMVVGGGITGVQAALDLAESGFYVYLIEKGPSIGGAMAQLDKTFPTNDCSVCILSPKLVECGRHRNIRLITMSDVEKVEGEPGRFSVTVRERARYVDMEKCIACGLCAEKCPQKVEDNFNQGLNKRKAAYISYPQAVPLKYLVDDKNCIYFKKGKCKACEKFCPTGAVNLDQKDKVYSLDVGSIILAPGFKPFDPHVYDTYGYGRLPNVITSMEFERILSASGPFEGHLVRPSDHKECNRIAWLQCVGSRDLHSGSHPYCSSVCCTYAVKEAVIAKEHATHDLDTAIFYMDMRTYGKDFERYANRAKNETGVRFIRSRVHSIDPVPGSDDLRVSYVLEDGTPANEDFDMIVLSVGMEAPIGMKDLAEKLQVKLDPSGFAAASSFSPVATSRDGIYVCGAFSAPKDIPSSIIDASAASAASAALLSSARSSLTKEKTYPPEVPVTSDLAPRIGVFICHCGFNIGKVVNVPEVRDYARNLPGVAYVADNLFTCSQDTQALIREAISEHKLNRVVVAACTPRTHEPLFQETMREAGLNGFLFDMANIRDQDSWVHQAEPEKATQKAKDLVRMAVAKASLLEPVERAKVPVNKSALVIGGGVAGMSAAVNLADQGFQTFIAEKSNVLGGNAARIKSSWKGEDTRAFLGSLKERVLNHPQIEVLMEAEISNISGFVGQFTTNLTVQGKERELEHGAVIVAIGAEALKPSEYLYGQSDRVTVWHELEELFEKDPSKLDQAEAIGFIQCVGSREPNRPYCSKVCCTASLHEAISLKTRKPDLKVYVLYRDLRTYGLREELYTKARELGILFIRFPENEKPVVEKALEGGKEKLQVTVRDHVLGRPVKLSLDYLNLASAIVPAGQTDLARTLKVPLNEDGFFLEAHMKLRPVEFATDGVFICGLAHSPKPLDESIAQAQAAAARAASVLSRPFIETEPIVSMVDQEKCTGCGLCEKSCPFGAIRRQEIVGKGYLAETITASCKGCGVCAASCPQKAIDIAHFRDKQLLAAIHAGGAQA